MSWQPLNPATTEAVLCPAFSDQSFAYCHALSQALLNDPACRAHPELIALGFWLRPTQLQQMLRPWRALSLRPLGQIFHAAPANVDSLFVYSGLLSLLCGNSNWIRLSSRALQQTDTSLQRLLQHIQALASQFPTENARFQLISCDYQAKELQSLLQHIDGRVLWGSNEGIQAMRTTAIPAHARELSFAHKFSLVLLGADAINNAKDHVLMQLCEGFVRDNLTFAQQACASAKTVIWLGDTSSITAAQQRFWHTLAKAIKPEQQPGAAEQYLALQQAQRFALEPTADVLSLQQATAGLQRASIRRLSGWHSLWHGGGGFFLELVIEDLTALSPMLRPEHQTLSYWGLEKDGLQRWQQQQLVGLDRVVPVGEALNFSPIWDGVDLIRQFSRETSFR